MVQSNFDKVISQIENGSQTLAKGLLVLEMVANFRDGRGARLVEICKELGINKSTAFRLLSTLETLGYVERDLETERYRLGLKILTLSTILLEGIELRAQASPFLNDLMIKTNHAVHLAILDQKAWEVVYIDKVDSPHPVRMYTYVGIRFPANCTSVGKAILAYLPQHLVSSYLKNNLPSQTPKSIISSEKLLLEFEQIRAKGYAVDNEENALGIHCIGAPIFDHKGRAIASISISSASAYLSQKEIPKIASHVVEASQQISQRLGYLL